MKALKKLLKNICIFKQFVVIMKVLSEKYKVFNMKRFI